MKVIKIIWKTILYIRQFIFAIYMLVITIIFASLIIVLNFLKTPTHIKLLSTKIWSKLAYYGMFTILWLKFKIKGKNNILKNESCIYISKHHSIWETIIFSGLLFKSCFVLKEELIKIPLLGRSLTCSENIPINRLQGIQSLKIILSNGKKKLKNGINIIIFPEGTRVKIKEYPKFYKTAIILSKVTNSKIIPIAHNSGIYWPNKVKLIKPGCITIQFGKAISYKKFNNIEKLNKYFHNWINNKVRKLGA